MVMEILVQFAIILVVGLVLKAIGDKIRIPYIILLMLAGTVLATQNYIRIDALGILPDILRTLALIIVAFSAGFFIRLDDLKKQSKAILSLATIGVVIATIVIAGVSYWMMSIPLVIAVLIGAILAGNDPSAIAEEGQHSKVLTILKSEAILNNPLTVILPFFILSYLALVHTQQQFFFIEFLGANINRLVNLAVVGVVIGIVAYRLGAVLFKQAKGRHAESIGLIIAITTYVVAELFGGSGIFAVAICSIFLANTRLPEKKWLGEFNAELAFVLSLIVFVLLGAEFNVFDLLIITRTEIIALIAMLFLGRIIATFVSLSRVKLRLKEKFQIALIAPKGLGVAALVPLLLNPVYGIANAKKIVVILYIAIIISIILSLVLMKLTMKTWRAK